MTWLYNEGGIEGRGLSRFELAQIREAYEVFRENETPETESYAATQLKKIGLSPRISTFELALVLDGIERRRLKN